MKSCQTFHEWLEASTRISLDEIPAELKEHVVACQPCREDLQNIIELRQCAINDVPPDNDMEQMWRRIDQTIFSEKAPKARATDPCQSENPLSKLLKFLLEGYHAVQIGAVALLALFFLWFFGSDNLSASIGKVTGTGGKVISQQMTRFLTTAPIQFSVNDSLALNGSESWAEIAFQNGRSIVVEGSGQLQFAESGFRTEHGQFQASFKKGRGSMNVIVPGAVLGIRGTAIRFDLSNGEGSIKLLEGAVEVTPSKGKAFEWKQQTTLQIKDGNLLPQQETEAQPASKTIDLRNRPAEY